MRRLVIGLLLAVLMIGIIAIPAFAVIPNPDSITFSSAQVVRNSIETGDMAFAFHFKIAYATWPTSVTATDSFYLRLYATNGTTLIYETNPYTFLDYGYNDNIGGFYFSAADVTTYGLVWGTLYKITIAPIASNFSSPPVAVTYTLQASDYSAKTAKTDVQKVMADYIKSKFYTFEQTYSGLKLLTTSDVGDVLTSDGENWLRGAFPGVASVAPSLFYIQYYVPTTKNMGYTNTLGTTYQNRYAAWDIKTGLDYIANQTGLASADMVIFFIVVGLCLIFVVFCAWKGWGVEPGLLGSMMILECGGLLFGGTLFNAVLFIALMGGIFIVWILWLRRT